MMICRVPTVRDKALTIQVPDPQEPRTSGGRGAQHRGLT